MKTIDEIFEPLVFADETVIDCLGEDIQFISKRDAINAAKEYHDQFSSSSVSDEQDWESEYKYAVNEIKSLQKQLDDAEAEIRQLNNELRS